MMIDKDIVKAAISNNKEAIRYASEQVHGLLAPADTTPMAHGVRTTCNVILGIVVRFPMAIAATAWLNFRAWT
jgi:hypothetical protein